MFGASAYTAAEGGQVEVTVTLSAGHGAHDGRPHRGDVRGRGDERRLLGVSFASGETSQTIVKLSFGAPLPAGVTAGTPNETTVSITDDDDPR